MCNNLPSLKVYFVLILLLFLYFLCIKCFSCDGEIVIIRKNNFADLKSRLHGTCTFCSSMAARSRKKINNKNNNSLGSHSVWKGSMHMNAQYLPYISAGHKIHTHTCTCTCMDSLTVVMNLFIVANSIDFEQ